MQLYFDKVNKGGGVNGNTFALVRKDNRGLVVRAQTNVRYW
jgi:hypothetical protein